MLAAFLPLPPKPHVDMVEHHDTSHSNFGYDPSRIVLVVDEARYNSARWWRNLNRGMSIVGLILIGAAIALIVVGVKQQWGI